MKYFWTYLRALWPFQILFILWIVLAILQVSNTYFLEFHLGIPRFQQVIGISAAFVAIVVFSIWLNRPLRQTAFAQQLLREGKLAEAEAALSRAFHAASRWTKSSPQWPNLLLTRANLEGVRMNFVAAEDACRQALEIQESLWGDRSFAVIPLLNYLATIQIGNGDYQDALDHLRRSLAIYESPRISWVDGRLRANLRRMYPGIANFYRAFALQQRGIVFRLQKRWESSIETLEEALDWYGWKDPAPKHQVVQLQWLWRCVNELAKSQIGAKRFADASQTLAELKRRNPLLKENAPRFLPDSQFVEAALAFHQGHSESARNLATDALAAAEAVHAIVPGRLIEFHLLLGQVLAELRDDESADKHLKKALELCREYKAPHDALVADCLDAYAQHSLRTGRVDQGNEFMIKATNIRSHHA